jgi:hypothetical protein
MEDVDIFYGHLVYFTAIRNILWPLGMVVWYVFPLLVCCTKKNLATLVCCYLVTHQRLGNDVDLLSKHTNFPIIKLSSILFLLPANF